MSSFEFGIMSSMVYNLCLPFLQSRYASYARNVSDYVVWMENTPLYSQCSSGGLRFLFYFINIIPILILKKIKKKVLFPTKHNIIALRRKSLGEL